MHRTLRKFISIWLVVALALGHMPAAAQDYSPAAHLGADQIAACRALDQNLEVTLKGVIKRAFEERLPTIDIAAAIDKSWDARETNKIIAARLQVVGDEIIRESSTSELLETLKSIWGNNEKIEQFIEKILTRTMNSPDVKDALAGIATETAEAVGVVLAEEIGQQRSALQACITLNIGERYGAGFARLVRQDLEGVEVDVEALDGVAGGIAKSRIPVIGLSGVALIALRGRIQRYVVRGVVRRTIGGAIAKIVAEVATGIGIFLIAYDIWTLRNGFVPKVVEGMREPKQLTAIKQGLKSATREFLESHTDELAAATATAIHARWQEIERNYAAVTALAEKYEEFRAFLMNQAHQPIAKIADLVAIARGSGGDRSVLAAVETGEIGRALDELDAAGVRVARDLKSLSGAIGWQELAGDKLALVEEYGLHRVLDSKEETAESLEGLLALGHLPAIKRVAKLDAPTRAFLTAWGRERSMPALFAYSDRELMSLRRLVTGVSADARDYVEALMLSDPPKIRPALKSGALAVVLSSADQKVALMSLVSPKVFLLDLPTDFTRVVQGDVSPRLLVHKHPLPMLVLGIVLAILLLSFLRLLFGRKTRVVVRSERGRERS